jgi:hypothetical protein
MHNDILSAARTWREYTTADFGTRIDMRRDGCFPRRVVLKAAGDLLCEDANGVDASLTGLPAWYVHPGDVSAILPGQQVALIVYW